MYGKYHYLNGNIYEGEFENSIKNGRGIIRYNDKNNTTFEGNWKQGKKKGPGRYYNAT